MIEEYWDAPSRGRLAEAKPYDIGERIKSGRAIGIASGGDC